MNIPWLGFVRKQEVHVRRLLVAGLAALAVVLGLTLSVGTAFAAAPAPSLLDCVQPLSPRANCDNSVRDNNLRGSHTCVAPQVYDPRTHRCETPGSGTAPTCVLPQVLDTVLNVCVDPRTGGHGGGNGWPGGYGGGHGYPGTWGGPRIDGRYLWLDQNLSLDVCSDSTYGGWYNRNLSHRDGILRLLGGNPNARWMQLHSSSCGSGVSISNDGQCVTFRQEATRWGNDLNTVRRDWSGLRLRLLDVHHGWNGTDLNLLSLSERNDWNRLSGLDRDRFNSYNRVYGQLRTICNDPNPPVVIVQAPAPVTYALPAPVTAPSGNDAASAPLASAPLNSALPAPAVAPNNGGDSAAWVLAHNRAV